MAETKKSRKQRKDKGKKRGKRIANPRLQQGKLEFKTIGTNVTRLVGLVGSTLPRQPPIIDYQELIKNEFKKLQESQIIVRKNQSIDRGQEEANNYEEERDRGIQEAMSNRIQRLRREEEEAQARAYQAEERATDIENELRGMSSLVSELSQSAELYEQEVGNLKQQRQQLEVETNLYKQQSSFYDKKSMYEHIMRTTGSVKEAKKEWGLDDLDKEELNDFRKALLDKYNIKWKNPEKSRGGANKPIFAEEMPEGVELSQVQELEEPRIQMEAQAELLRKEYESKLEQEIAKRSESETMTLRMVNESVQSQLAQAQARYEELQRQGEEEHASLVKQSEAERLQAQTQFQQERMALEGRIQTLTQTRDEEIARGLAFKEAETKRLTEDVSRLEREGADRRAEIERLMADNESKKGMIEEWKANSISKREHEAEIKEYKKTIAEQDKSLKYLREQEARANKLITKQQMEKIELEQKSLKSEEERANYESAFDKLTRQVTEEEEVYKAREGIIRQEEERKRQSLEQQLMSTEEPIAEQAQKIPGLLKKLRLQSAQNLDWRPSEYDEFDSEVMALREFLWRGKIAELQREQPNSEKLAKAERIFERVLREKKEIDDIYFAKNLTYETTDPDVLRKRQELYKPISEMNLDEVKKNQTYMRNIPSRMSELNTREEQLLTERVASFEERRRQAQKKAKEEKQKRKEENIKDRNEDRARWEARIPGQAEEVRPLLQVRRPSQQAEVMSVDSGYADIPVITTGNPPRIERPRPPLPTRPRSPRANELRAEEPPPPPPQVAPVANELRAQAPPPPPQVAPVVNELRAEAPSPVNRPPPVPRRPMRQSTVESVLSVPMSEGEVLSDFNESDISYMTELMNQPSPLLRLRPRVATRGQAVVSATTSPLIGQEEANDPLDMSIDLRGGVSL